MAWTEDDRAAMDAAAEKEIAELKELMQNPKLAPGILAVAALFAEYRMSAGYKRVGKFLADTGKQIAKVNPQ